MTAPSVGPPHAPEEGIIDEEPKRILVIETDPGVRWALEKGLARSGFEVSAGCTVGEAVRFIDQEPFDGIIMELLPEAGLDRDLLSSLVKKPSQPRVICVSVDSEPQTVIECMRRGATDFVPKPFSLAEIRTALGRAMATSPRRSSAEGLGAVKADREAASLLIGISLAIQELRTAIEQVAQTDLNCLLRGESGTGKDLVAREIHRLSRRKDKPFVKVNCTALPEQLLESELFGYEKGAFTGAVTSKPGRFELAHQGIIFLDEIGEMHPNLQSKLLEVIEHKEFAKLGGVRQIHVDVQIIAATNADLEKRTKQGTFRDDLYFRLNEVCLWVPPLSVRKEDVPLLAHHFIQKHSRFMVGKYFEISGEDLAQLTEHDWPGNVRELESTIKRWLALGKRAFPAHTPASHTKPGAKPGRLTQASPLQANEQATVQTEAERLVEILEQYQWNRRKAAEALGMSYQTLRRRIEKYGLNQPR